MKTKLMTMMLLAVFTVGTAGAVWAAKLKCTVESVEGATVVLNCGDKAGDLDAGAAVIVKSKKAKSAKKAIEGC